MDSVVRRLDATSRIFSPTFSSSLNLFLLENAGRTRQAARVMCLMAFVAIWGASAHAACTERQPVVRREVS